MSSAYITNALDLIARPLTILVGHFGSGKSEIALNLAFGIKDSGRSVILGDLDLVKPYFRCRLLLKDLLARGIELVVPAEDRFYADLPILVPAIHGAIARAFSGETYTLLDVGGDDTGARALGALSGVVNPEQTDLLFVVNFNRPFAEDEAAIISMVREVETAARLKVTGFIANTHLMDETTPEIVQESLLLTTQLSEKTNIPVRFGVSLGSLTLTSLVQEKKYSHIPMLAIERYILPPHVKRRPGSQRSLAI